MDVLPFCGAAQLKRKLKSPTKSPTCLAAFDKKIMVRRTGERAGSGKGGES